MRTFAVLAALGWCSTVLAADPVTTFRQDQNTAAASAPSAANNGNGGHWCRSSDGRWVWVAGANPTPQAQTRTRSYSYYRPLVTVLNDLRPDTVAGIEWYLNGRGPFSD